MTNGTSRIAQAKKGMKVAPSKKPGAMIAKMNAKKKMALSKKAVKKVM